MRIALKTEDLPILHNLDENEKQEVLSEFSKGSHFLSVYFTGLLIPIFVFGVLPYLKVEFQKELSLNIWTLLVMAALFGLILRLIEVNLLNKKVIQDILKRRSKQSSHRTSASTPH